jgi:CRP-like cAMP-binding protein
MQLDPSSFVADPALIEALQRRSTPILCIEDRVLFRQGDPSIGLFIVAKGSATLSMVSWTGASVMNIETADNSLLGLPGLIGNEPYSLTAVARAGADVRFVGREDFLSMMQSEPQLALKILAVLAAEVRSARMAIKEQ